MAYSDQQSGTARVTIQTAESLLMLDICELIGVQSTPDEIVFNDFCFRNKEL